ncbi:MAG: M24 family metallopeptidase [bacterium]
MTRARSQMPHGWGRVPYAYADRLPWMNLPFPLEEYHARVQRLRALMARDGWDCVVATGNQIERANIRYLTNFEDFYGGESVLVVPANGAPGFATNAIMHGEPMHSGIQDCWIEDVRCAAATRTLSGAADAVSLQDHLDDLIMERGAAGAAIGVIGELGTDRLIQHLTGRFPLARVGAASRLLAEMRAIKSLREVEVMRKACHLADVAMRAAMDAVRPGVSEFDLAAEANYAMFRAGAEHPAFAIALGAGPRSGFKHVAPTGYRVREGDMVYIDVGGRYMGYCSDGSRQRVCGDPTDEQRRFMETQISIVETTMRAARPGTVIGDLATIGQTIAREAGFEDYLYFRGHGIGCATHDLPAFTPANRAVLEENMVFAYEPMLVRKEFGTACWEDIWWVTAGGVERLNRCPIRWW